MATIVHGGGGISEGTATAADVLSGKTFSNDNDAGLTGTLTLSGSAAAANVLKDKTFYNTNAKSKVTGTMANNGAVSQSIGVGGSYTVPAGYHNGSGKVTCSVANKGAITGSVGVGGTYSSTQNGYVSTIKVTGPTLSGDAAVGNVLKGKTFYSNSGTKQTGTMANNGAVSQSIGVGGSYTVPAGYHNGSGKVSCSVANKGAITGSVGVGGTYSSTQNGYVSTIKVTGPTLSGNAGTGDVLSGKTFYSNSGTKQTGTITDRGESQYAEGRTFSYGGPYKAGYNYDGDYIFMYLPAGYYHSNGSDWAPELRISRADAAANGIYAQQDNVYVLMWSLDVYGNGTVYSSNQIDLGSSRSANVYWASSGHGISPTPQGSTDGSTWTNLGRKFYNGGGGGYGTYTYRYYRWMVKGNQSSSSESSAAGGGLVVSIGTPTQWYDNNASYGS